MSRSTMLTSVALLVILAVAFPVFARGGGGGGGGMGGGPAMMPQSHGGGGFAGRSVFDISFIPPLFSPPFFCGNQFSGIFGLGFGI